MELLYTLSIRLAIEKRFLRKTIARSFGDWECFLRTKHIRLNESQRAPASN